MSEEERKLRLAALEEERKNYAASLAVAKDNEDAERQAIYEGNLKEVDKAIAALTPTKRPAKRKAKK